jgi:inner membrane protein YidH
MDHTSRTRPGPVGVDNPNLARDHLANERTFLAWLRTGIAIVVFGLVLGRLSLAYPAPSTTALDVALGATMIIAGVLVFAAGLAQYHRTRDQIEAGRFRAQRRVIDIVGLVAVLSGLLLAGYLVLIDVHGG